MPSDRSRRTDGLRHSYKGVVAQQGRVTLDRDVNAEHGFVAGRIEAEAIDLIGPCGTPDDGFAISIPLGSPPPPLWSPPAPLSPPTLHPFDFLISPGTMYVGGERAVFPARPAGHPVTYSYFDQPDWIPPHEARFAGGAAIRRGGRELVFLALVEQEVGAVEDPDLLEVALGGPDTTQRLRLSRRVVREPVTAVDCTAAWAQAVTEWRARDGLVLDPASMRLKPQARLLVSFANTGGTPDPCDPIAQGGYLGAENQTIRVQIADAGGSGSPGGEAQLLWGYDNASFTYRAVPLASNPKMLTIAPTPPDAFHIPQSGQVVEILRTESVLASEPDMSDTSGSGTIVRCVAQPTGIVRRLTQSYGPVNPGDPTSYIVLNEALPAEFLGDATPLFLRVWQSEIAFDPGGDTVLLTDDVTGASTGIEVTLSLPPGKVLTRGAYWLLAVRPSTPQAVYPEQLLTAPQPSDGPRLWACPLAVIDWSNRQNPQVTDCRNQFDNLVDLSRRRSGCCTVAVSPTNFAAAADLQGAIDRAARLERGATVCLAPGRYALSAPLRLTSLHAGITIEACGGTAVLSAAAGNEAAFSDGLVVVTSTRGVTLRGLTLIPAVTTLPEISARAIAERLKGTTPAATLLQIIRNMRVAIGVHAAECLALTLEACAVEFESASGQTTSDVFGVGLFLQGDCAGIQVRDCSFTSRLTPSFHRVTSAPAQLSVAAQAQAVATSPPAIFEDFGQQMLQVASSSFDAIAARTVEVTAEVASNVLVVTVGCMAMLALDANPLDNPSLFAAGSTSLPCLLGAAALSDNSFDNLTMAFYGTASADNLRIEDNNATQCIGGFWLQFTGWKAPQDPEAQKLFTPVWQETEAFEERLLLDAIGLTYPLPTNLEVTIGNLGDVGPASLFVTGNQVEPVSVESNGTTALLILANLATVASADTSVSLVAANNRLRSRSGPQSPTALLLLQEQQRCSITGNLFLSENSHGADPGPSLWLVPDGISKGTSLLAVVGNVLQGRSDLNNLHRTGVTPPQTWALYNAMPS